MKIKLGKKELVIELRTSSESFEYLLEQIKHNARIVDTKYPKIPLIKSMRDLSNRVPELFELHNIPIDTSYIDGDNRVSLRTAKEFVEKYWNELK